MLSPPERPATAAAERYRLLFDGSACPMWVFDAKTLAFLEVNEAAVRLYGYSREEFLSMTIKDIRPPDEEPRLVDAVRDLPKRMYKGTWRHVRKDGSPLEVEVSTNGIEWDGRPACLVVIRDVTQDQRARQAMSES